MHGRPAPSEKSLRGTESRDLAEPRFSEAVGGYCRTMAATDAQAWPATKLFHQYGRYMVSFLLIHHYQDWRRHGGPRATLSRLQASCPLSPRQTAAIVAGLRAGKLLTTETLATASGAAAASNTIAQPAKTRSGRANALIPGSEITRAVARPMVAVLAAADQLDLTERAPRFVEDFALQNELVYRSARFVERHGTLLETFPRVRLFTEKDCGYLILCAVMASALNPSAPEQSLSCRNLARHFRISRSHVGNLLAHASAKKWFATDGRARLAYVAPDLMEEFKQWVATEMEHYAGIADDMLARESRA